MDEKSDLDNKLSERKRGVVEIKERVKIQKSRALIVLRSGTKTAKSIKPTKISNAATANNTRRNQTPDAAETAVLAAGGVNPEQFSDTLASCDSFDWTS